MEQTTTDTSPLEVLHISVKSRFSEGREQVAKVMENFAEAIRNGNIETIMSFYSKEIVAFDMMPPLSLTKNAYRKNWESCFTSFFSFPINYTFDQQMIDVSGDLAIVRSLVHFAGDSIHGENMENWMRSTIEMKRIDGKWLIVHEHTSVPLDEVSGKGLMTLSPDGGNEAYQH